MILWGPPGSGKTTLARIVAETTGAAFEELSAVSRGVEDVRGRDRSARASGSGANGRRTILFLDEIHRFNKAQQDALLPAVEDGLVTLIGATTENPYFEVNAALLSRCTVFELEPLSEDELAVDRRRGAAELGADVPDDVVERDRARARAATRARRSTSSSSPWQTAVAEGAPLEERHVDDAARKRPLRYDRAGDQHYDIVSAFIKSMRGSDPDAAVYYLAAMLEGGEDARFIARRMVILASEDVGNADPRALVVAVAAAQAVEHVGLPEAQLNLAQAAIYLARAPKSNASATAIWEAAATCASTATSAAGDALRDAALRRQRRRGHGEGYVYPHDDPPASRLDTCRRSCAGAATIVRPGRGRRGGWRSGRVTRRPSSISRRRTTARPAGRLQGAQQRPARLPSLRLHRRVRGGGARPAGEPRVVPERRTRRSCSCRATRRRRARRGGASSAPSTRSPRTSGRTAPPPRRTASSTRRTGAASAERS